MLNPTKHNLKKLEQLFEAIDYKVRYEKGNFQSGYCLVKDSKIAVINKFYDTPGRITCLIDILQNLEINQDSIEDPKLSKLYKKLTEESAEDTTTTT